MTISEESITGLGAVALLAVGLAACGDAEDNRR